MPQPPFHVSNESARFLTLLGLLFSLLCHSAAEAKPKETSPSFVLQDAEGAFHRLEKSGRRRFWVVAFLGTECPLAKHYSVRLQQLRDEYADRDVEVIGVMSNSQDTAEEIRKFIETHKVTYPVCRDEHNRIADLLQAERTPEVFLIDNELQVRYHGRIDDQFQIGVIRSEPSKEELRDAIEAVTSGKSPAVKQTEPIGCIIGREQVRLEKPKVTYSNQIVRLFQQRCVDCHREGQAAPFALNDYEQARGWAGMIEEVVRCERMPPWHAESEIGEFKNDCSLTEEEKQLIYAWVEAGTPEGNPDELPTPKTYATDWLLPSQPDLVLDITEEPVDIPATGEVKYKYYRVDPKLKEDVWVRGAEIRPGNYAVVHHILVFARTPGQERLGGGEEGGFLAAYVPGLVPELYPTGMAKKLAAGSELIFQVHYTPIGSAQQDQSQIALVFADPDSVTHQVTTTSATNRNFKIPPGEDNHEVIGFSPRAGQEVQLLAMMPHMHLRGKSFRYELHTPDGETRPLLSVPNYDFNWQTAYRLAEPISLPVGSQIKCTAHFDNSEENPYNPDPSKEVKWGDQTWEEMMIGYFDVAIPLEAEQAAFGSRAHQFIARLDRDNDGKISIAETPAKWYAIFLVLDADKNGQVTAEELEQANRRFRRKQRSDDQN